MAKPSPFRYFKTSREIIRLAVMMYIRFLLSLRNVEDLLHERSIDVSHETVRFWWQRFAPLFTSEIGKRRVQDMRSSHWRRQLDEVFVKINGEQHYLWRAVDHQGEVLERFVTKMRDRKAALKFLKKTLKRHGSAEEIVTDLLRSYERYKSSNPIMPRSSTISIRNAASSAGKTSRPTAPPLSPSGVNSAPPDSGRVWAN